MRAPCYGLLAAVDTTRETHVQILWSGGSGRAEAAACKRQCKKKRNSRNGAEHNWARSDLCCQDMWKMPLSPKFSSLQIGNDKRSYHQLECFLCCFHALHSGACK